MISLHCRLAKRVLSDISFIYTLTVYETSISPNVCILPLVYSSVCSLHFTLTEKSRQKVEFWQTSIISTSLQKAQVPTFLDILTHVSLNLQIFNTAVVTQ